MSLEHELLQRYANDASDEAFAQLVRQYVDMVYAAARRQVRDADLAQDVTQAVFIVLAQKAATVPPDRPLSAWLLRTTSYCAANARRTREHRTLHERRAAEMARNLHTSSNDDGADWEQLAPLLDEGLNKLGAGERDALLLKFFEKKTLRQVGEALGISEEAATKRVSRGLERLRVFFRRRGAVVSAVALSALLASESAKAAPIELAGTIATGATAKGAAVAGTSGAASVAKGAMIVMATQKLKAAAIAAGLLIAGIGGVVLVKSTTAPAGGIATVPAQSIVVPQSMTKSRYAVGFSDGTSVDVLGICDPDEKKPQWWSLDGSAAAEPKCKNTNDVSLNPGDAKRRIVLRMSGKLDDDRSLKMKLAPEQLASMTAIADGDDQLLNYVVSIPANQATTTMSLGYSRGPFTLDESLNVNFDGPEKASGQKRMSNPREMNGRLLVDILDRPDGTIEQDELIRIELKDGTKHYAYGASIRPGLRTWTFRSPKRDVARVVIESRPSEWVRVTNVAMHPTGTLTDVKVQRPKPPENPIAQP